MIDPAFAQLLARYNRWQNESLFGAADGLEDSQRRQDRGAFFKSIHATLNHLLWADRMWMSRFSDAPKPDLGISGSTAMHEDWEALRRERALWDGRIVAWADGLDQEWLKGDLAWFSAAMKRDIVKPRWVAVAHFFNHQTHHRGQVHAMLTAAGAKPDDTDLAFMPPQD
ncbi:MAG TPA: DinB family protein [Hypericibacter adhaerens]|jgi:uncharacterized damage-inducible protein DinB|uniref:Damage-inducible protein DinB n=1 Tax=Hypericibacter adhaerens TaxID=2602016 RepID=A0A5J6N256_9PROT|nr:DinB family protein [Hypericibacter adhaerens]QEX23597.1 damage-inducible protein DinB [Hypericibacter adhaerens]HWA41667.1 DinB family protein [Hypericibacter adhaerens]